MSNSSSGRRRAYRSRHKAPMGEGGRIAVIVTSIALVLFVFAVILGNYLRGLATSVPDDTSEASTTSAPTEDYPTPPSAIKALGVVFGKPSAVGGTSTAAGESAGTDDSETGAPEDGTVEVEFDALSVELRRFDRERDSYALGYKSELADVFALDINGDTELEAGLDGLRAEWGDAYISGVFEIGYASENGAHRDIIRQYEYALLCELVKSGIDEIILIGFSDDIDEGLRFISELRKAYPDACLLGLALDFEYFDLGSDSERIVELSRSCGLIALDLSDVGVPELMSLEDVLRDRIGRAKEMLSGYSIRLLLGGMEPSELAKLSTQCGVFNFVTFAE